MLLLPKVIAVRSGLGLEGWLWTTSVQLWSSADVEKAE